MPFGSLPTRTRGQMEPMLSRMENFATQNGGYEIGYLRALNSNINIKPGGVKIETQEDGGKFQYWRLLYRNTAPISTFGADGATGGLDICTRPTEAQVDWTEEQIFPSGGTKVLKKKRIDPTWLNDIALGNFNSEMEFAFNEILEQARNELNMKLLAKTIQATGPVYVGPQAVSGPLLGGTGTAVNIQLPAYNDAGQVSLAWIQRMREVLSRNGMGAGSWAVHGYGTMYNLISALNAGVHSTGDNGIDGAAVANLYRQLGWFNFMDTTAEEIATYGTAPNNVGLGRDDVLLVQPGAIHPLFYNHHKGRGKEILDYDSNGLPMLVKTTFRDQLTGVEWDFFINYEKCQANGQGSEGEYWMGLGILADQWYKPTTYNRGPLSGTNQIVRFTVSACAEKDCAGANATNIFLA